MTVWPRRPAALAIAGLGLLGTHLREPAPTGHVIVTPAPDGGTPLAQSSEAFLD
jgi:hypothetical protein